MSEWKLEELLKKFQTTSESLLYCPDDTHAIYYMSQTHEPASNGKNGNRRISFLKVRYRTFKC